ncbi:MAG TPA: hypothetical protein VLX11_06985 [Candidatus Acidoferrales bacterium]|nr:hypothetical protein [Candidatus Acidoferrales bacterium]
MIFVFASAGLLSISTLLHFWRLGSNPPGFFSDESANAYNAYCVTQTGTDQYGTKLPLFFCGNEYRDPVIIYSMVPFVKTFGLLKWAARFPSALFHILASIAFAFLVMEYCHNEWLAVLISFCFSIVPWGFVVSRTAVSGYTPMLLGIILGWLWALLAFRKQSCWYACASGVAWAVPMYSYIAGHAWSPVLLICLTLSFLPALRKKSKVVFILFFAYAVALSPMVLNASRSPGLLTRRFKEVSVYETADSTIETLSRIVTRYAEYYSPGFLFLHGDNNLRQNSGFEGELFLFLSPLAVAGLYEILRSFRTQPQSRFLFLGLLTYPMAAAWTHERMHSGRTIGGVIVWMLIAAIGANCLWRRRAIGRALVVVASIFGAIEIAFYLKDYFVEYPIRSRNEFRAPLIEALEDCLRITSTNETLYISSSTFAPWGHNVGPDFRPFYYTDILFFGRIDPLTYQRAGIPPDKISLFSGTTHHSGVLLRCNMRMVQVGRRIDTVTGQPQPYIFDDNVEPIPPGAELLEKKPVYGPFQYEIYRVNSFSTTDARRGTP